MPSTIAMDGPLDGGRDCRAAAGDAHYPTLRHAHFLVAPPSARGSAVTSCARRSDMLHRSLVVLFVAAIATLDVSAQGQPPAAPPTYESVIGRTWKGLHDKILVMAKDTVFPDDKLGWKPHPDSRSVLDEFRHVTIGLEMTSASLKGEKFDYVARDKADASKPKT